MKTILAGVLLFTAIGLSPAVATASDPSVAAPSPCLTPDVSRPRQINWFLGLSPSDDLLTAWCRIQELPGNVRFNVQWPVTGAHKSWDTSFSTKLPASRIVDLVQSLLPTDDKNPISDSGVPFADVLQNAVELDAPTAPDGTVLGFAPAHPAARQIVLWEPLGLRIKPVVIAGQEFTLSVYLRPNLGMLALGLTGRATDVQVKGWSGRLRLGNFFKTECSEYFPDCATLPEVVTMHMPLIVDEIRLDATGDNMTKAAVSIGTQLYRNNMFLTPVNPMESFDTDNGRGVYTLHDGSSTLDFKAEGTGGTKKISIIYKAVPGKDTLKQKLTAIGDTYRAGTSTKKPDAPKVPDSFGKL